MLAWSAHWLGLMACTAVLLCVCSMFKFTFNKCYKLVVSPGLGLV
jgi:hypothetical protein